VGRRLPRLRALPSQPAADRCLAASARRPGVFVPASSSIPAHHALPAGPGLGEPDIFEHAGLQTWGEYRQMGGRSPNYDEKLPRTEAVLAHLRNRYGDRLAARVGAMIDPRISGGRQGIEQAVEALVRRDRVDTIVVAYMGVGFSDIMQTHHLRHHLHHTLETLGVPDLPVRYAQPLGTTDAYVDGIVERVRDELTKTTSSRSMMYNTPRVTERARAALGWPRGAARCASPIPSAQPPMFRGGR
jgi:hypothetical protein